MKIDTLCVQGGWQPKCGEPRQVPVVQTTTFKYDTTQHMADLFDLKASGYFYTRLANPTNDAVAKKIAALEGGVAAILTSSGQAASTFAVLNLCNAGDHVVSSAQIYGGTFNLFAVSLKKLGIEFTFVDPDASPAEIQKAFRPNTKCVFGETVANPSGAILDIAKFAKIAHRNGVPLIVDNTFPTPILCRPFEFGCDIVTHATTKYMDGHSSQVGGCIVDSGNFDWTKYPEKFAGLVEPDPSYHGLSYTKTFGKMAYIVKCTAHLMRDFGSIPSPFNAFLVNLGLESLHVRIRRHAESALKIAKWLKTQKKVAWVNFAGLPGNKRAVRGDDVRDQGRAQGVHQVHGRAEGHRHRHARRGRVELRPAPGVAHAPPAHGQAAEGGGHPAGPHPTLRRPGGSGRPHRRPQAGACQGEVTRRRTAHI